MSDYERGLYYARYKAAVRKDQMLSQKILGFVIAVIGIAMQIGVGVFEFAIMSSWIVVTGIYLILTRKLYM